MAADLTQDALPDLLPVLAPGLHDGIPEELYHGDRRALSQSNAKVLIQKSPAHFRWVMDHPPEQKQVFDVGSAAHRLVLGVGQPIEVIEVEVEATRDGRKQRIIADNHMFRLVQEAEDRARKAGKIPLLPAEFQAVQDMADKLSEHTLAMELLSEGQPEVTAYAHDQDCNVWMRGRFDFLGPTVLDYKTSTTSEPDAFLRKAIDLGYDFQAAWYIDLLTLCGFDLRGWAFLVQEKTPPFVVTVIVPPPDFIERGRRLKRRALEMFRDCTEAGKWPGYVPDTEFATPAMPPWALAD